MFRACQFFHKLEGFLAIVFLQVFFDTLSLFSTNVSFAFLMPFFFLLAGWLFYKVLGLKSYSSFASVLSVCRTALVCVCADLLCWSVFAKDVVGCFCHGSAKASDQAVYFGVLVFKG